MHYFLGCLERFLTNILAPAKVPRADLATLGQDEKFPAGSVAAG